MKFSFLMICSLATVLLHAQAENFITTLEEISSNLPEVTTRRLTYNQTLTYDEAQPYRLVLTSVETSSKGKTTENQYRFNLSDISKNMINWESGNEMKVRLKTERNQKFIKTYVDGEQDNFTDEVYIYCTDIDQARKLTEQLKGLVPTARKRWEEQLQLPTEDRAALSDWLTARVGEVATDGSSVRQELTWDKKIPTQAQLIVNETNSKGDTEYSAYQWDFADIDPNGLNIRVKGSEVYLEISTRRRLKYISQKEDDQLVGFTNKIQIYTPAADEAKQLQLGIEKMIEWGESALKERLPQPTDATTALDLLMKNVQSFTAAEKSVTAEINTACAAVYQYSIADGKGGEQHVARFDFADLSAKNISVDVSKMWLEVGASTAKKKPFIQLATDDDAPDYEKEITFYAADVETARRIETLLPVIIDGCPSTTPPNDFAWLATELNAAAVGMEEVDQQLSTTDNQPCKWLYVRTESGRKSEEELSYEFNLVDIDADQLQLDVHRAQPFLTLETNHNEKVIKYFSSGGDSKFLSEIELYVAGIGNGKTALATIKSLVNDCAE